MAENELFRTTLMGGYDKDDVERHIQKMKDEAYVDKNRLLQLLKQRDKQILELNEKLDVKEAQLKERDRDIKEKYQSYIDNYEQIGRLVYESRVRADRMIIDAREESRRIIQEARNLAQRRLEQVQAQIDDKLDEGREKHRVIQRELDEMLELLKEVRKRCMQSYDNVEKLVGSYTEQADPFADVMLELEERTGLTGFAVSETPSVQDQISYMKSQLENGFDTEDDHFDEEDSPEDQALIESLRHVLDDDDDEESEDDFPEIQVMSVEEVLKSMDEQKAEKEITEETAEETEEEPDPADVSPEE